jgi:hypothetical protein
MRRKYWTEIRARRAAIANVNPAASRADRAGEH